MRQMPSAYSSQPEKMSPVYRKKKNPVPYSEIFKTLYKPALLYLPDNDYRHGIGSGYPLYE